MLACALCRVDDTTASLLVLRQETGHVSASCGGRAAVLWQEPLWQA